MVTSKFYFVKDKFNKYSIKALLAAVDRFLPDVRCQVIKPAEAELISSGMVFYSFNTLYADRYLSLVQTIRNRSTNIVHVCGGSHPSARPEDMAGVFDVVCVGEGEQVIIDVIQAYLNGESLSGILQNHNSICLDDYGTFAANNRIFGPIELTRGCKFSCAYCQVPQLYGHQLRHRSLDSVFEQVRLFVENEKYDIRFLTPDAVCYQYHNGVNFSAIEKLLSGCRNILGNRGRLFFGSFPSEINPYYMNERIVQLMTEFCDNRSVVIGLQSASPKMLKQLGRPVDVTRVEQTIEWLIQYGFDVNVDFILGMPGEDSETIADNMKWIAEWKEQVRIHAHYFMPLPSSRWENETPLDIPSDYVRFLTSLEGKSRIYGGWRTQKKLVQDKICQT